MQRLKLNIICLYLVYIVSRVDAGEDSTSGNREAEARIQTTDDRTMQSTETTPWRRQAWTSVPFYCEEEPCSMSEYCHMPNMMSAHPTDCTSYYQCIYGYMYLYHCGAGLAFNPTTCVCDFPYNVDCLNCPITTPRPIIDPGTCEEVPEPCEPFGRRYADESDCEYFYECQREGNLTRVHCEPPMHQCHTAGYACIFDIHDNACMHPYEDFDCYERCSTGATVETPRDAIGHGAAKMEPYVKDAVMLQKMDVENLIGEQKKPNHLGYWKTSVQERKIARIRRLKSKAKAAETIRKLFKS